MLALPRPTCIASLSLLWHNGNSGLTLWLLALIHCSANYTLAANSSCWLRDVLCTNNFYFTIALHPLQHAPWALVALVRDELPLVPLNLLPPVVVYTASVGE
jgi:hypothetical protein